MSGEQRRFPGSGRQGSLKHAAHRMRTCFCPTVASLRVGDHHFTTLLKPLGGCIVVISVLNDTCERSTNLLNQLGNRESRLGAAQPCHRHSGHLASRKRHVSKPYFSPQVLASRSLDRPRTAISNSHQFKRVLKGPVR